MKNAIKKSLKSDIGIMFAVLAVILAVTVAVFAASAESPEFQPNSSTAGEEFTISLDEINNEYNYKNEPVIYKLTANNSGISNMVIPVRTDVLIDVNVEQDGYYKVYVSEDANTGNIPIISKFDENGMAVEYSSLKENSSDLMMYLEEGVHNFGISNNSFDNNAEYYFNAELCDDFMQSFDSYEIIPIDFYTEVSLNPKETKVFKIENTKDDYTNFICAKGEGLSVEIFDDNLVSCGYDSSELSESEEVCQYVVMRENATDDFFAVVSNNSDKEVTVSYNTDLEVVCKDRRILELNTPVSLMEENEFYTGQGLFRFIPDETREYEFNFASFTDCDIHLILRNMVDYSDVAVEESGAITNGTLTIKNVTLEKGKTYVVIVDSCYDSICNPNITVK